MTHYSIDIETLATTVDAHILAVGIAWWEEGADKLAGSCSMRVSDRQEGRRIDPATVRWWLRQSDEARASVSGDAMEGADLWAVLAHVERLVEGADGVWTMDPSFDAAILRHAAFECGMTPSWSHRLNRCVRTARAALPDEAVQAAYDTEPGAVHSAERDARVQARIVMAYQAMLRG